MSNPKRTNWIRLTTEAGSSTFHFASRDWKVLVVMQDPIAELWQSLFGFYQSTCIPDRTIVLPGHQFILESVGIGKEMLQATRSLMARLDPEKELLACDYKVRLTPGKDGEPFLEVTGHGIASFEVGGKYFGLTRRPGLCRLQESKLRRPKIIDLRRLPSFQTDDGIRIDIKPIKRDLAWLEVLPSIESFLDQEGATEVTIQIRMK